MQIMCIYGYKKIYVTTASLVTPARANIVTPGSLLIGVTPYEYVTPCERVTNKYAICIYPTHVCDPYMSTHIHMSPHTNRSWASMQYVYVPRTFAVGIRHTNGLVCI